MTGIQFERKTEPYLTEKPEIGDLLAMDLFDKRSQWVVEDSWTTQPATEQGGGTVPGTFWVRIRKLKPKKGAAHACEYDPHGELRELCWSSFHAGRNYMHFPAMVIGKLTRYFIETEGE